MIICWFYKNILAGLWDENSIWTPILHHHRRVCPSCRQFHQIQARVSERLMAGAPGLKTSPSPFLHARIMAAINRHEREGKPAVRLIRFAWTAPLASVGLAVLFLLVLLQWQDPAISSAISGRASLAGSSLPAAPLEPEAFDQLTHLAAESRQHLANAFAPLVPQLMSTNSPRLGDWGTVLAYPLEQEIGRVVDDAKSAVQVLAQNFLPNHL